MLIIGQDPFITQTSQGHSPQSKIDFPYHKILGPDICSLICIYDSVDEYFLRINKLLITSLFWTTSSIFKVSSFMASNYERQTQLAQRNKNIGETIWQHSFVDFVKMGGKVRKVVIEGMAGQL